MRPDVRAVTLLAIDAPPRSARVPAIADAACDYRTRHSTPSPADRSAGSHATVPDDGSSQRLGSQPHRRSSPARIRRSIPGLISLLVGDGALAGPASWPMSVRVKPACRHQRSSSCGRCSRVRRVSMSMLRDISSPKVFWRRSLSMMFSMTTSRPPMWSACVCLVDQQLLLVVIPVVEDVAHHDDVRRGDVVGEEVAADGATRSSTFIAVRVRSAIGTTGGRSKHGAGGSGIAARRVRRTCRWRLRRHRAVAAEAKSTRSSIARKLPDLDALHRGEELFESSLVGVEGTEKSPPSSSSRSAVRRCAALR